MTKELRLALVRILAIPVAWLGNFCETRFFFSFFSSGGGQKGRKGVCLLACQNAKELAAKGAD